MLVQAATIHEPDGQSQVVGQATAKLVLASKSEEGLLETM